MSSLPTPPGRADLEFEPTTATVPRIDEKREGLPRASNRYSSENRRPKLWFARGTSVVASVRLQNNCKKRYFVTLFCQELPDLLRKVLCMPENCVDFIKRSWNSS